MKQKILAFLVTVLTVGGFFAVAVPTPVAASGEPSCGAPIFLGFRPWYANLCTGDSRDDEIKQPTNQDEIVTFIWTVVLNVLYDLLLAVGYLAIGFVVYGGFLYITAQGDPGKAAKGQKTLTTAVIGTVLAMAATVIVNTAKIVLGIDGNDWNQNEGGYTGEQLMNIFSWIYTVAGIVAVVFIVKGGIEYVISRGDPSKVQKATRALIYAVVGLVIVLLAAAVTTFIISSTSGALGAEA